MSKAKAAKQNKSGVEDPKLAAVIAALEKDHGAGIVQVMSGAPTCRNYPYQVKTGSIGLDIAIGPMKRLATGHWQCGDVPGSITEVWGPEGCGKTTLMLTRIANYQSMGLTCAMVDMEHALDPLYAKSLGVDMTKLLWSQPDNGEQAIDVACTLMQSGALHFVGLDSIAAMIPKAELENASGEFLVGAQARLMSQFMRKAVPLMGKNAMTSLMCINQIRFKVGRAAMFGSPETQPGGNAMKYAATFRIDVRKIGSVTNKGDTAAEDDGSAAIIGQRVRAKIVKNKVSPPFRIAEFNLIYGQGIDTVRELFDLCTVNGIIAANGAWYTVPGVPKQINGGSAVVEMLRSNQSICYSLYNELMTRNMAFLGLQPDGTPIPGFTMQGIPVQHKQFEPPTAEEQALAEEDAATPVAA